jgi:hypothetical protein
MIKKTGRTTFILAYNLMLMFVWKMILYSYCDSFRTMKLSEDLSEFKMGNDSQFLAKLTKNIFHKHLDAYIG